MSAEITIIQDLRGMFGPARDQGSRPTCLAFAASDTHAGARPDWEPLSCEFVFFRAQKRAKRPPATGATLTHTLEALRLDGQPQEAGWPYMAATPVDLAAWAPPLFSGPMFGRDGHKALASFKAARSHLAAGSPVMLLLTLSPSFFSPTADGVVKPFPGEAPQASVRHAVIGVGSGQVDDEDAILIRNSWGSGWGLAGHAWITESFVSPRLFALAILGGEVDVPPYSAAA
ncbi:Peptidase C1 [Beijerinckiaceae bacterium RH AL1]|nr:Peptidase C1 [Beijerinckiaceae bacterium RH AL8]VVB42675.1 Peptidase C1 [Beijerinckiaceae bacterium RH CH11]VVC53438.1 Peptidase C1 [Beijerinckiaceae bacterium RH AL1]